jgi:hypothetical protein
VGACEHSSGSIQRLTALTNLKHFTFSHPEITLGQPSRFPHCQQLQGLEKGSMRMTHCSDRCDCSGKGYTARMEIKTLQALTNLTHLELYMTHQDGASLLVLPRYSVYGDWYDYSYDDQGNPARQYNILPHLSCLVKLQTLMIQDESARKLADRLDVLQSMTTLTCLHVGFLSKPSGRVGPLNKTPWLHSLTALQSLCLEYVRVDASQLLGLSQLTVLHLFEVQFSPTDLLDWLGKLTQLQHLGIKQAESLPASGYYRTYPMSYDSDSEKDETEGESSSAWPPPSAAYAALTASSELQELSLTNCQLPAGVWRHAIPAGRFLPQLRSLYACCEGLAGGAIFSAGQLPLADTGLAGVSAACQY